MTAGTKLLFLFCLAILSQVNAQGDGPFFDPDENDDSVTVIYAGFVTIIDMKENNREDSCIAVAKVTGSEAPVIRGNTESSLGLRMDKYGESWCLYVSHVQDYDRDGAINKHDFRVAMNSNVESLTLNIINVDDNKPVFNMESSTCEVNETFTGLTECKLTVIDADGILDDMKFEVLDSDGAQETIVLTEIGRDACERKGYCIDLVIEIKEHLDFLDNPVHSLKLQATDQIGNVGSFSYMVQVKAVNKNIPSISPKKVEIDINEGYSGIIDFEPAMNVIDYDSGDFGQFSINLEDVSAGACFHAFGVIPNAAYLNTTTRLTAIYPDLLDYEDEHCRNLVFEIVATEKSDPTHIGRAEITINLVDINDESPKFVETEYKFSVPENEKAGYYLGTVVAEDKDEGDKITYFLSSENFLTIDALGNISTATMFDYERQSEVIVTVRAVDEASHTEYVQITLSVQDINDEKPILYMPSSPVISEISDIDLISVINATDLDATAQLQFSIDWPKSRATKQGVEVVDRSLFEGCIKLENRDSNADTGNNIVTSVLIDDASKLNWEHFDTLYLEIKVEDSKTDNDYQDMKFSSATLTINIKDENNNPPVFSSVEPITVAENTEPLTLIGFAVASDADGPGNDDNSYYITCNEPDTVMIDLKTGQIRTGNTKIDYESLKETGIISCTVIANDTEHEASIPITISVRDVNDETPYFVGTYEPVIVYERTNKRKDYYEIKAEDKDGTAPYNSTYIESSSPILLVDPVTRQFYLKEGSRDILTYDRFKPETVQISIADNCADGICALDSRRGEPIKIDVTFVDINDHGPVFPPASERIISIIEEVKKNEFIINVNATDDDVGELNKKLAYSIMDVKCIENCRAEETNIKKLFDLKGSQDGTVDLVAAQDLDTFWGEYSITIKATDHGICNEEMNNELCKANRTETTSYTVNIIDINNHRPVFENAPENIEVNLKDNTEDGQMLKDTDLNTVTISAVDIYDRGINGSIGIRYVLIGNDTALDYLELISDVDPTIKLTKGFTNETEQLFQIQITASDANKQSWTMEEKHTVNIRMKGGQNAPIFEEFQDWNISFPENETDVTRTLEPSAIDPDNEYLEDLEEIYYYIVPDGVAETKFTLEKTTKILSVIPGAWLDREERDSYTFYIAASNNENGLESNIREKSKLGVNVKVIDVVDTPPKFAETLYVCGISIGDKISSNSLTTIAATDEDLNDKLSYDIIETTVDDSSLQHLVSNDKEPFDLEPSSGILRQNFNADDNSLKGTFVMKVQVKDSRNFADTATLKVYMITDDNILVFTFSDNRDYVESKRDIVEEVFSDVLQKDSKIKFIRASQSRADDTATTNTWTDVSSYFVDTTESKPISKDEIRNLVNAQETFNTLTSRLAENYLHLRQIESPADAQNNTNMEGVLQTVLIVVSVVLGTLVIILFAAFFIKTRSLNRRLEALSTTKFGSQDSGMNRIGIAVPNTNRHAVEGSNPVWGNEDVVNREFDNHSISSGDSDLIGVEENPEFRTGNITPDLQAPRRPTGLPILLSNAEHGTDFSPFSSTTIAEIEVETGGRRQSVNPLAGSNLNYVEHESDQDSDTGSPRSSNATTDNNSNFIFSRQTDSTPITEL